MYVKADSCRILFFNGAVTLKNIYSIQQRQTTSMKGKRVWAFGERHFRSGKLRLTMMPYQCG